MINEKQEIIKSVESILSKNKLMSLSTSSNNLLCICTLFFAYDKDFNLYFWSEKTTIHSLNIQKNKKVAVSIADSSQSFGSILEGLKIYGKAELIENKDLLKGGALYIKRFSKVKAWIAKVSDLNSKFNSRMDKVKPKKIIVLDEKKFGKEEYKELMK